MSFSIETTNLLLRPFKLEDATDYFHIVQDPLVQLYTNGAYIETLPETKLCFKMIYAKADLKNDFYIAIEEKSSKKLIGAIFIVRIISSNYDCAYFLDKNFRNKGYMVEALTSLLPNMPIKGFIHFDIHKTNLASLSVIRKIDNIIEAPTDDFPQIQSFYYDTTK